MKKIVYDHANGSQIGWKIVWNGGIIKSEINFVFIFTISHGFRTVDYNDDELYDMIHGSGVVTYRRELAARCTRLLVEDFFMALLDALCSTCVIVVIR